MAERTERRAPTTPARPLWRRRRFWQVVIAIEVAGALAISFAADDAQASRKDHVVGLATYYA